mmetsp:Transcript_89822/g.228512  ORF Transcript_89822/g.228512 Transcript_89822/m.228512 type:complete len:206 (+) Transcript_89822:145-762(+)
MLPARVREPLHREHPPRIVDDILPAMGCPPTLIVPSSIEADGIIAHAAQHCPGHMPIAVFGHLLDAAQVYLGLNDVASTTDGLHVRILHAGREVDGTATDAGLARVEFTTRQNAPACCFGGLVEQCHHVGPARRVGLGPVLGMLRLGVLLDLPSALEQRHVAAPLGIAAAVADVVLLQQRLRHVVPDSKVGGGGGRLRGGPGKAR